jgi:hypothetical protein
VALPFFQNFDTGQSSGTAISLANSAGGINNTAVSPVGTAPTYSNGQAHSGTLSMLVAAAAASSVSWTLAAETHIFGRFYFNPSAIPTSSARILQTTGNVTGANLHRLAYLLTTGNLQASLTGLSPVSSVNAMALGVWTRIEYDISVNGATAAIAITTFPADSRVAIETFSTSRAFTDANLTLVGWGCGSSISPSTTYFDDAQVNNTGLPGPALRRGQPVLPVMLRPNVVLANQPLVAWA